MSQFHILDVQLTVFCCKEVEEGVDFLAKALSLLAGLVPDADLFSCSDVCEHLCLLFRGDFLI